MDPAERLRRRALSILRRLARANGLGGWIFAVEIRPLPARDIAEITFHLDAQDATVSLDSRWREKYKGDLARLLGHELAHILVDDIMTALPRSKQRAAATERLTDRIGVLLALNLRRGT